MEALYQYQSNAIPKIEAGKPTYLGFDPGLGKSRTALEGAKARGVTRLLIVSPASGRYVWERECRHWWPEMAFRIIRNANDLAKLKQTGITLITYGLLSQKLSPYASVIANGPRFQMTILDEAAALKNSSANRTKAVFGKMLPKLGYVLPMSGTPAPNHAGELFPILRAIYPQALERGPNAPPLNEWDFQDAFCRVTQKRFGNGTPVRVIEGSKNLPELRRRLDGFMLRVKKEDVLKDLPPIRWDLVPVQPSQIAIPTVPDGLSDDLLLKWLSGASGDEHVMRLRRLLGVAKVPGVLEYLEEFMDALPTRRKILVFAHHQEVVGALRTGLAKWNPAVVVGGSTPSERTAAINTFLHRPECRVFIGNIQAAGTALTLVGPGCACSDVFFAEASYSVGDNVQAACRVHRIGQRDAVVARFITARGTIDDRIQSILARKAADFNDLFN